METKIEVGQRWRDGDGVVWTVTRIDGDARPPCNIAIEAGQLAIDVSMRSLCEHYVMVTS